MLLELDSIRKQFGAVAALRAGDLRVDAGEVHLLLGENGAGKSTLMRILAGIVAPDAGRIVWQGREVAFKTPADAAAIGIAMVHQESLLAPQLTVAENIFLGREIAAPFGIVPRKRMVRAAAQLIEQHRFPLEPECKVERLSPAAQQMVEICRAIQHGTSLLIFDEPTSSLSTAESDQVLRIVAALRERGAAVIYITHRLEELRSIGDRVTVLRDGATVHSGALAQSSTDELIAHMVGRAVDSLYRRERRAPGNVVLQVERLSGKPVRDVSFEVRAGEIVGVAGLIGAGRTELCETIFGARQAVSGSVRVNRCVVRAGSTTRAVKAGIALVTEDRQRTGLALRLPICANITAANLGEVAHAGVLSKRREHELAAQFITRLRIRATGPDQLVGRLSGGNQQKVAIAKWLLCRSKVFLFDEPTRGIDIGAKVEVFQLMDSLACEGAAILMVSSELPELLQMADRILVMRNGSIAGELPGETTQEEILRLAALEHAA